MPAWVSYGFHYFLTTLKCILLRWWAKSLPTESVCTVQYKCTNVLFNFCYIMSMNSFLLLLRSFWHDKSWYIWCATTLAQAFWLFWRPHSQRIYIRFLMFWYKFNLSLCDQVPPGHAYYYYSHLGLGQTLVNC